MCYSLVMYERNVPCSLRSSSKSYIPSKCSFANLNMFRKDNASTEASNSSSVGGSKSAVRSTFSNRPNSLDPSKIVKQGPKKVQKAMVGMAASFDQLSQRLRKSTRRRYRLTNSPFTPSTPARGGRENGRRQVASTPTSAVDDHMCSARRLYSPFGIDSPGQSVVTCRLTPRRGSRAGPAEPGCDNAAMDFSPAIGRQALANVSNTTGRCSSGKNSPAVVKTTQRRRMWPARARATTVPDDVTFYSPSRQLRSAVSRAENSCSELQMVAMRISASRLPAP